MISAGRPTKDFRGNGGSRKKRNGSRERPNGSNSDSKSDTGKSSSERPFGRLKDFLVQEETTGIPKDRTATETGESPSNGGYRRKVLSLRDISE